MNRVCLHKLVSLLAAAGMVALAGCVGSLDAPPGGFLSDYSVLPSAETNRRDRRYVSPDLARYDAVFLDPVEARVGEEDLSAEARERITTFVRDAVIELLERHVCPIAESPGEGVARVRLAITQVKRTQWFLNLLPAMKLSGIFRGGAALEGEIVDSVSGRQLAAGVVWRRGSQFELDMFSPVDDVKDVVRRWLSRIEQDWAAWSTTPEGEAAMKPAPCRPFPEEAPGASAVLRIHPFPGPPVG